MKKGEDAEGGAGADGADEKGLLNVEGGGSVDSDATGVEENGFFWSVDEVAGPEENGLLKVVVVLADAAVAAWERFAKGFSPVVDLVVSELLPCSDERGSAINAAYHEVFYLPGDSMLEKTRSKMKVPTYCRGGVHGLGFRGFAEGKRLRDGKIVRTIARLSSIDSM